MIIVLLEKITEITYCTVKKGRLKPMSFLLSFSSDIVYVIRKIGIGIISLMWKHPQRFYTWPHLVTFPFQFPEVFQLSTLSFSEKIEPYLPTEAYFMDECAPRQFEDYSTQSRILWRGIKRQGISYLCEHFRGRCKIMISLLKVTFMPRLEVNL